MRNTVERMIVPREVSSGSLEYKDTFALFAPVAGTNKVGMARYDADDFDVKDQRVSLKYKKISNIDSTQVPIGIEYNKDGYKTPNTIYDNYSHAVQEYGTNGWESVTKVGSLFVTKLDSVTHCEIFVADNVWSRVLSFEEGAPVTEFFPLDRNAIPDPDNLEKSEYSSISGVTTFKDNKGIYRKIPIHYYNNPSTIAVRDNAGRLAVSAPTGIYHAVNKTYAEDNFVPNPSRLPSLNSGIGSITFQDNDGEYVNAPATHLAQPYTIPVRASGGTIGVGTPDKAYDAANKKYVDDADIVAVEVTPVSGIDGKFDIVLHKGDGTTYTASVDLPLEMLHIADVQEEVGDDGITVLKISFTDGTRVITVPLDDVFRGYTPDPDKSDTYEGAAPITLPCKYYSTFMKVVADSLCEAYTLAMRGKDGTLHVGAPSADDHAATKKYVDDAFTDFHVEIIEDVLSISGEQLTSTIKNGIIYIERWA